MHIINKQQNLHCIFAFFLRMVITELETSPFTVQQFTASDSYCDFGTIQLFKTSDITRLHEPLDNKLTYFLISFKLCSY